ncbi:hypothetical protein BDQ17DRAFT_391988 [Cyathus striatus]|nr:hypothetical protein BDQ17DRAFT_391988 [Cyathus striatus]
MGRTTPPTTSQRQRSIHQRRNETSEHQSKSQHRRTTPQNDNTNSTASYTPSRINPQFNTSTATKEDISCWRSPTTNQRQQSSTNDEKNPST